ncbi:MAG: TIM barrel protein [Clostridia bacterium]|nr:TIM barrel protein [Clostridia bacterium]
MKPLFGPAGNCDSFNRAYKGTVHAPRWLRELGLDCYEYQCGRGVNLGEDTARRIGAAAAEHGIQMSLHSPYFINLSSREPERVEKNLRYIAESCRAIDWMGGDRVVVHCGGLTGMTRQEALENTVANLAQALQMLEEQGLAHIRLCIETMGKLNVLGDAEEVFAICRSDARLLPCIDYGHLNARTQGGMNSREAMRALLDRMAAVLGEERAAAHHAHFSKIEYSKGGEVKHLTFEDAEYGPEFALLAEELALRGWSPQIICESAGTQAEDALEMKRIYQAASRG